MQYKTIHTTYGLQCMAQAEATGVPINLTHMSVGDGNGNPVTPTESQTALVREVYRATVNRVYQDPTQSTKFTAELVVPATVGGFVMREVGVFDEQGGLFAVGNLPATYKPNISEGAYSDTVVRMEFLVTNASVVTIQIDPNIAVASQTWVLNNITSAALIPGGTTSQVLRKKSNADGDTEWADPGDVNVTVDMIEERQTLAALQTTVTMAVTTTRGLAVYIEGVRISKGAGADEWSIAGGGTSLTQIVLGRSYPEGTNILLTQNEPTGSAPAPLERSQNLADVDNKATARTNLDVFSKTETRQMAPSGLVAYFARSTAPIGWLKANGAAVSRTVYAELFAAIGATFGPGDGFNTFNLPDMRGEFLRCWDDGRGVDAGRGFGGLQFSQNGAHTHSGSTSTNGSHVHGVPDSDNHDASGGSFDSGWRNATSYVNTTAAGDHSHTFTTSSSGGNESRPRNVAMLACIKY